MRSAACAAIVLGMLASHVPTQALEPTPAPTQTPRPRPTIPPVTHFAQLGDQRIEGRGERDLQGHILLALLNRYAASKGIVATEAEIAGFHAWMEAAPGLEEWDDQQDIERLRAEVADPGLSDRTRQIAQKSLDEMLELSEETKQLNERLARDRAARRARFTPEQQAQVEKSLDEMAKSTVLRYRINEALYREYGGRLIIQQAGLEPVDAYLALIDAAAQSGELTIEPPATLESVKHHLKGGTEAPPDFADEGLKLPWEQRAYLEARKAMEQDKASGAATGS